MIPTPIQLASDLLGIHHHLQNDDCTTTIIYKEDELLALFKKWGFPDPDWEGNARELHEYTLKLQEAYLLSPPGATIRECMEARNMSVEDLAGLLGIPVEIANDLLVGVVRVPGFAERLEEIFGVDKQFWSNRQKNYDRAIAKVAEKERQKTDHEAH